MKGFDSQTLIELRASAIRDPVERLRFLRKHGVTSPLEPKIERRRLILFAAAALLLLTASGFTLSRVARIPETRPVILPPPLQTSFPKKQSGSVWLVDHRNGLETYSNGLRIETRFEVSNIPRAKYQAFPRGHPELAYAQWKDQPAGIVYHTTESQLAPFAADQNRNLQRLSSGILEYVQRNHAYHFLIDRFGRISRVVKETDIAFHAGHSVWADESMVYVNLNSSFLGVAFETQTQPGEEMPAATQAQVDAGRLLTGMLRAKYTIAAQDCVTHAQVSVNPSNMRIGYHTDWAGKFPFTELGLGDNYAEAPASLTVFGFVFDPAYLQSTGAPLIPGLLLAETQIGAEAVRRKVPVTQYRASLQKNYKEIIAASHSGEPAEENAHEH